MLSGVVRRVGAWGSLLAFAASLALPVLSTRHLAPDADDGVRLSFNMGERLDLPAETGSDEHCAVCHWMRAVAGASVGALGVQLTGFITSQPTLADSSDRQGRTAVPAGPSRAPPARLV